MDTTETSNVTETSSNEDSESTQKSKFYYHIYKLQMVYYIINKLKLIYIIFSLFSFFISSNFIVEKSLYHIIRNQLTTN